MTYYIIKEKYSGKVYLTSEDDVMPTDTQLDHGDYEDLRNRYPDAELTGC